MATKIGLKKDGTLKKGYKYAKGGRIVKVDSAVQTSLFGGVVKSKNTYAKGSSSNTKSDSKRTALKPGKRVSKTGKIYYESRKNRSDVRGRN